MQQSFHENLRKMFAFRGMALALSRRHLLRVLRMPGIQGTGIPGHYQEDSMAVAELVFAIIGVITVLIMVVTAGIAVTSAAIFIHEMNKFG
jgi:hypothetical protein